MPVWLLSELPISGKVCDGGSDVGAVACGGGVTAAEFCPQEQEEREVMSNCECISAVLIASSSFCGYCVIK